LIYDLCMPTLQNQSLVLSFEDARSVVEQQASRITASGSEDIDLLQAAGRVLAEPIVADRDIPPFPRSTRDGYAVRSADLANTPARLKIVGEIKAGPSPTQLKRTLHRGEAFSIMTGAPVPHGADAVVMVEYTSQRGEFIEIAKTIAAGANIVRQGAEALQGTLLLEKGTRLNEAAIALAASVGKSRVRVFLRPRVAVLTTGDEIVDLDAVPGPAQIRNSNSYSLAIQIIRAGADPIPLPIAPDEAGRLRQLIEEGLQADLLLITGGVSMGRYDLVEQVLQELQAEFFFTGARIQPGRPVVFGRIPCGADTGSAQSHSGTMAASSKYLFGLPGNPVSTMITFELFARPMIEDLAGMPSHPLIFLHARLKSEIRIKAGLRRFLPAILSGQYENSQVELVPWQGSGDIAAQSRANCLLVIAPDRELIAAGEWVPVMPREL
jgi:molybdopterin molybdotransferase